jgi:hypothetical protein
MDIQFFDDPIEPPRSREDVRIRRLGVFVYPDKRRIAVGFDITPFLERPSIEVTLNNANGELAGSMTIVDTVESNFTLTMHLRDKAPTEKYTLRAELYYTSPDTERADVHQKTKTFDMTKPGEQE